MTGTWIASKTVSGSGNAVSWDYVVTSGQSYRMVCDYLYDDFNKLTISVPYGKWTYELPPVHTPLQAGDWVVWSY